MRRGIPILVMKIGSIEIGAYFDGQRWAMGNVIASGITICQATLNFKFCTSSFQNLFEVREELQTKQHFLPATQPLYFCCCMIFLFNCIGTATQ